MNRAQTTRPSRVKNGSQLVETLTTQVLLGQATDLARLGRYAEAEEVLRACLKRQEPLPIVLDLLARIAAQQGRLGQAAELWQRAAHLDPGNAAYQAGVQRIEAIQHARWSRKRATITPPSFPATASADSQAVAGFGLARPHGREWRYELVRGRLVKSPVAGGSHDYVLYRLLLRLGAFVEAHHLGAITLSQAGYDLTKPGEPPLALIPDLAFVQTHRVPTEETPEWTLPWKLAPDLVAEVSAPGQSQHEMGERARVWLGRGVQLVWVIWPAFKTVEVWRPGLGRPWKTLGVHETLEGRDVVPGFTCPVAHLFQGVRSATPS